MLECFYRRQLGILLNELKERWRAAGAEGAEARWRRVELELTVLPFVTSDTERDAFPECTRGLQPSLCWRWRERERERLCVGPLRLGKQRSGRLDLWGPNVTTSRTNETRVDAGLGAALLMWKCAAAAARRLGCGSTAFEEKEMDTDLMGPPCPDAGFSLGYRSDVWWLAETCWPVAPQTSEYKFKKEQTSGSVFHDCTD